MTAAPRTVALRAAGEADHPALVAALERWVGPRAARSELPRVWLRHFAGTCSVAESDEGGIVGFLVGFLSQGLPDTACLLVVAVAPSGRRRGVGRALVEGFCETVRTRGARRLEATCRPDDRAALAFLHAVGFRVDERPGSARLYGTPAFVDWNHEGDDRVLLGREI